MTLQFFVAGAGRNPVSDKALQPRHFKLGKPLPGFAGAVCLICLPK